MKLYTRKGIINGGTNEKEKESKGPEVETEIRGIVEVMNKIMIDQIGEEAIAVNVEIDQDSEHQNKKK